MTYGLRVLAWAALVTLLPAAALAGTSHFGRCEVPPKLVAELTPLPQTHRALAPGKTLRIVAIGSTSSTGQGTSSQYRSYVRRLGAELQRRLPGHRIDVIDKIAKGQSAMMMRDRIVADILPLAPALIVWETGTTDSIHHLDPTDFGEALETGIARSHEAGADVVIITPRFSPPTAKLINFLDFRDVLLQTASTQGAGVFHRWDIMRHLFETGNFAIEPETNRKAATEAVDGLNACLAQLLADTVIQSLALP